MNKCQHGEPITLFCLSDYCMWRDAGGCPTCFKKFHNQGQSPDPLSADKLQQACKKFIYESDNRLKSKYIQQAVCNYFIIMKNQLTLSIDAVSKSTISKLSYPFLNSQGQYSTFRKIKSKQYRKISKKQLKNFMNFASSKNKQDIELKDRSIYLQEINQFKEVIKSINDAFNQYGRAIQKIDNSFSVQKSFYNKILQNITAALNDSRFGFEDQKVKQHLDSGLTNEKSVETQDGKKEEMNYLSVSKGKVEKIRKVSLDVGIAQQIGKLVIAPTQLPGSNSKVGQTENYSQNERQIMEKKKKLFELLNTPNNKKHEDNQQENKSKKSEQSSRKGSQEYNQIPEYKINIINVQQKVDKIQQKSIQKEKQKQKDHVDQHNFEKIQQNEKLKSDNSNLFNDLLGKGINFHEFILHTILPRQPSRQKLYEDTKQVKEKKVKVQVNFDQQEEVSSPILKKKKLIEKSQKKQIEADGELKKIKFNFQQESHQIQILETKENQKFQLKDKQAQSLALLLQSLSVPAQKAVPLLEASIKYAYNNLSAAEYLSFIYLQLEKPKQCLQLCNKILEQIQDSPHANQLSIHIKNNKAAALNMLGRYSQSITILEQCLQYCKRDIIYKNLGDAYFSIGIFEKACLNYQNGIRLNDHMDQAYYNLSVCYFLQDHFHEARLNILKALKLSPRNDQYINLSRQIMVKIQE